MTVADPMQIIQRPPFPGTQSPRPTHIPFVSALSHKERQEAERLAEEARSRFESAILAMWETGASFSAIANALNLPDSTVKTVCLRAVRPNGEPEHFCANCGAPIQKSNSGREKRFCSRHCYNQWWHNTHDYRTAYHRICPVCEKAFTVYSIKSQKYCSVRCFQAARVAGCRDTAREEKPAGEEDTAAALTENRT